VAVKDVVDALKSLEDRSLVGTAPGRDVADKNAGDLGSSFRDEALAGVARDRPRDDGGSIRGRRTFINVEDSVEHGAARRLGEPRAALISSRLWELQDVAEIVLIIRGTAEGTEEPEQGRGRVIDALDVDDNPERHVGDQRGVLDEGVHVRQCKLQGVLDADSVGGRLRGGVRLRGVGGHELPNRGVSRQLQFGIALLVRGMQLGELELVPKIGVLLLEPCTVKCIVRVTRDARRRRRAWTTSSKG
jgi:hypothetical protein